MMKKIVSKTVVLLLVFSCSTLLSDNNLDVFVNGQDSTDELITVNFVNEPLLNIVQAIADLKKINIIVPHAGIEMKEKVTFSYNDQISVDHAWKLVLTLLDLCDYTVLPKTMGLFITKKNQDSLREPVPLFLGSPLELIPDTDNVVRYLYYFSNIKVPTETEAELNVALKELLSTTGTFKADTLSNSLLMQDKASVLRSTILFVQQFDHQVYQEKIKFVKLRNTEAKMTADLLNEYILKIGNQEPANRLGLPANLDARKPSENMLFAKGTKVIPIVHNNSIMLIGRAQAVDKLKEFIQNTLDQEHKRNGRSTLHVYSLQYINAETFAPVLQKIVDSAKAGGTGQSSAGQANSQVKGNERVFDEIIIRADKPAGGGEENRYYGGNNLIIACRNDDYEQIKKLIAQIDTPQPTVLLEILIVDLTIEDSRKLGSMIRNPAFLPLPGNMEFQSAQLDSGILTDQTDASAITTPTTIAPDLLQQVTSSTSIASSAPKGATLVSFNDSDGRTWGMLQVLKLFSHSKIVSQPHITTINNQQATVRIGTEKLLDDDTSESAGGAAIIKKKKVEAVLQIDITPRISPDDTVTLQIKIQINDFLSPTTATRTTREINTSANILSGNIFSLGGLTNLTQNANDNKTPFFEKIPIIGSLFFKGKNQQVTKNNLTVFICPTIIQPQFRKGLGDYTKNCIELNQRFVEQAGLFDKTKDPITRWFFKNDINQGSGNTVFSEFINRQVDPAKGTVKQFRLEHSVATPIKKNTEVREKALFVQESPEQQKIEDTSESIAKAVDALVDEKTVSKLNNVSFVPQSKQNQTPSGKTESKQVLTDELSLQELLKNLENPFLVQGQPKL
ncbi:hypothetical protein IPH67_02600 [bacterium]|nr:MAG: hypothetical protein IPH67_02600 [bacterium]